ncbi:restriction endonuclease [Streptomyces sp. MZ04]|uniref:restriction endonuclease n=1 Tax=Streptomyces sp. MZ04 TaxID=2559236 RepID=UPI0014331C60|nr:restriction endonuclease [Streptomyces sp. MZ04]
MRELERRRQTVKTMRVNAAYADRLLDAAARRVLLNAREEASVRYFEELVTVAPRGQQFVERAEEVLSQELFGEMDALVEEANAWTARVEEIQKGDNYRHQLALLPRFQELFDMHHREFEHYIAQLLHFDGFAVERWHGGAGDLAADVIVRLPGDGRRMIVQCKHVSDIRTTIGSGVIQQVNGTKELHNAEMALVVTPGKFTKPARSLAMRLDVQLIDKTDMFRWGLYGHRLLDLLADRSEGQVPDTMES